METLLYSQPNNQPTNKPYTSYSVTGRKKKGNSLTTVLPSAAH